MVFTEFYLNNELILPLQKNSPIQKSISFTNAITLKHHQNFIRLKFAALNFIQPEKNQYAYRMDGLLDDWQFLGDKHEVTFTNLDAGEYVLHVKGSNQEGFWNEKGISLTITVLPPWYRTWWAYTLWTALILGTIYGIYRFQLNRRLALAEAQHFKALDQAKSRLYTNITHEFRTPLTIILGMADQVRKDPKNWFNEGLSLILRNGKQLLNLVNQLLDLSKLESGHLPLKMIQGDLVSYLDYITESFHSYADSKDIRIHFRSDFPVLVMDYDPPKLQNILSNLLSNAIKFTPAGGDVFVDLRAANHVPGSKEKGELQTTAIALQVSDTGEGIAPEHLPRIFDRFYRADDSSIRRGEGTGIGLAMVHELVKVLGGRIEVESEPGKGARFSVTLPVRRKAETPSRQPGDMGEPLSDTVYVEKEKAAEAVSPDSSGRYTALLVEDNADVAVYLSSVLSVQYQIVIAANGQAGIDKALELTPDIVISDVMMPEKDGFTLCRELKTDERTSHIPIILLTAKADQKSRIEGFAHGADAYLAKPFHQEELLVRAEKLIEGRRRLQERFQRKGSLLHLLQAGSPTGEDLFLQKAVRIIESRMSDENFGMPQLCRELNMSRTNLFRKLKALTGKSATLLIRTLRLEKARELLESREMNVTEVAFAVGFNSPNYFARVFREEFGIAPSETGKGSE